jgi:iron(III) transport system ATP-binding protein
LLLLMDEPFSSLDLDLRERMGQEVRDILKSNDITCVMVTHDQNDAFALGDKVGVMDEGRILQWDTPYNLYHEPGCRFVADFIGNGVFLPGTVRSERLVECDFGELHSDRDVLMPVGTAIEILIRPDDVLLDEKGRSSGRVVRKAFKGAEILYTLRFDSGTVLLALFPSHANFDLGEDVAVRLKVDHLVAFEAARGPDSGRV